MNDKDFINDMQSRLAFQEDMIQSMSSKVAQHDKHIEVLQKQLRHLSRKLNALEGVVGNQDQDDVPPPHY